MKHLVMCRLEGAGLQAGISEPKWGGSWNENATKGPSFFSALAFFEFFATRQMIAQHVRKQIEEHLAESVKFCDGMMLVGGNLPEGLIP